MKKTKHNSPQEVTAKKAKDYQEKVEAVSKEAAPVEGEGKTEVVAYAPKTKEQEIELILDNHKQLKSIAPEGYVLQEELNFISGQTVKIQGKNTSLQSILYSGLKVVDKIEDIPTKSKPKVSKEKRYGPNGRYTEKEVRANLTLLRVYMPQLYEQEVWNSLKDNSDSNRSNRTGAMLGGSARWRR